MRGEVGIFSLPAPAGRVGPVRLGEGNAVAISPDAKWVLAARVGPRATQLVLLPTGVGEPKAFPTDPIEHFGQRAFFVSGKTILFNGNEPGRPPRSFVQDLEGGAAKPVTPEGVVASLLTLDGRFLVTRAEGGFALAPLGGGTSHPIAGLERDDKPLRFSPDGRSLFARGQERALPARVFRIDLATGRRELWRKLMPGDLTGLGLVTASDISADGKTIVFAYSRALSDLYLADGLK